MASSEFRGDVSQVRGGRDPIFSEAINQKMRVPDRLRVGPGMGQRWEEERQECADCPASYSMHIPDRLSLRDAPDMSPHPLFTSSKQGAALPLGPAWEAQQHSAWNRERDPYMREPVQSPLRRSYSDQAFGRSNPGTPTCKQTPHTPISAMRDSWMSPDEGSAAVEFIVLRRQVVKMSRRLVGLEKQNAERRQTELVLFSLFLSACLLNGWLWIRR
ncbi:mitochondrial fission factor homolog B-like isoform X3 [Salvelinus namaycush]|uniref:Mitochondrial fission factor n=1 Tax=Salvelinus namaycush TaxID=8040 RepID=A0A8U0PVH6_SALNM|nr:mitochondrial fission factor homolog B-like isoform X3 [Salvelinus namaycush]